MKKLNIGMIGYGFMAITGRLPDFTAVLAGTISAGRRERTSQI